MAAGRIDDLVNLLLLCSEHLGSCCPALLQSETMLSHALPHMLSTAVDRSTVTSLGSGRPLFAGIFVEGLKPASKLDDL